MADENVIAVERPEDALWKEVAKCQAEAMSVVELWYADDGSDPLCTLAAGALERLSAAVDKLEHGVRYGGMGAVAPMVTKVVDS